MAPALGDSAPEWEAWAGPGEDVACRRATVDDALPLKLLIGEDFLNYEHRYGEFHLKLIIETAYFSVTAHDSNGTVLGFAAFSDFPSQTPDIPRAEWGAFLHAHYTDTAQIQITNTLWLTFFVAEPLYQEPVINAIFRTLYLTLPDVDHVLFALPPTAHPFSPISDYFTALQPLPGAGAAAAPGGEGARPAFRGQVFWSPRQDVIPDLVIRKGKVEDYDDLMPLLLNELGVLTEMADDFYLDELLEKQDALHAVLVAEDSATGEIVGLMCMSSVAEDQQYIVKHFSLDPWQKLKRVVADRDNPVPGSKNCFQINFFFLNPDYESRAVDFLRPAFQQFPHAEYGFIRLPHSVVDHALLARFQYVPLKQGLTLKHGCFLVCRYALDPVHVRPFTADDAGQLGALLLAQPEVGRARCDLILANVKQCCSGAPPEGEHALALVHGQHVVGVVVVKALAAADTSGFVANFDVDSKIDFFSARTDDAVHRQTQVELAGYEDAVDPLPGLLIKHFYVRPIFGSFTRTLLREALRLLDREVLYYCAGLRDEPSSTLMSELTLALPRRITESAAAPQAGTEQELLTLHFTSRKLLSEVKTKIHSRIVVIGASSTGLSFIFTLLSLPYLHFSNIVLISRDGIPEHPNAADLAWFADTLDFLEREYILFRLRGKLRIIEGTMVDFERAEKYIVTDNGFVEPYDHLVVTTGRQYTVPRDLVLAKHIARNGVFPLSSNPVIEKIKQHVHDSEIYEDDMSNCVIYGGSLDSYCVMTSLIELGVKASRVVIVSPAPLDQPPFHDRNVEMKVDKLCESQGIKIYKHHVLDRMDYNDDNNLTAIYIENCEAADAVTDTTLRKPRIVEIPCTMFIYCDEKDIDTSILSALNKRSIVFDGRVIVENNYRTTDPQIYAAGPIAMFSRRFGPSDPFETNSSMEVGRKLCHTVLGFMGVEEFKQEDADGGELHGIDHEQLRQERQAGLFSSEPAKARADAAADDRDDAGPIANAPKPLPRYTDNIMCAVTLPLGFHYFHCMTYDWSPASVDHANNICTEDDNGDAYIRVSINTNHQIQSITYFGSQEAEIHNWKALVGLPQTCLNIVQRWNDGLITDVVGFLRQTWTLAVYYDKFRAFQLRLRERFKQQKDVLVLADTIRDHVHSDRVTQIDDAQRKKYAQHVSVETRHLIELELVKFLHRNREYLPIYFLPDITDHAH